MADHLPMLLNREDVWPDGASPGTFDIQECPHGVQGYQGVTAHILFVCPHNKRCGALLGPTFVARPTEKHCNVWGWNGSTEKPTLTPSLNCIAEKDGKPTGGCGWHGFITNGELTNA